MELSSPAFAPNTRIPAKYTCKGDDSCPPLAIASVPPQTKSLALIMHDPDATSGDFVHWVLWNIPPHLTNLPENCSPIGAVTGTNNFNKQQYNGPCPPENTGTHHYMFELYALDTLLHLPTDARRDELEKAMAAHTVTKCNLIGLFD